MKTIELYLNWCPLRQGGGGLHYPSLTLRVTNRCA